MDFFYLLIVIAVIVIFFLFLPKKEVKSKEQKQHELFLEYEKRMKKELSNIKNMKIYNQKKINILKSFSKELEFNIFFDQEDIRSMIKVLSKKDFY